jgi:lipoate---protein ligase
MVIIHRHNTDPYFNIATEEYVLKHIEEDSFMLWRNSPCIIVGKHQNTLAEINVEYVKRNNLPVVRRLSGGGAVFHDLGNLNFTFVKSGDPDKLIDFRKFTEPILDVLRSLDIQAKFEGRNDLTIGGKKFSGNAEHVWKNRVLHHGTLLFSSHMSDLSAALNADPMKFSDKAVKSVRSRVTNISEHLKSPVDVQQFAGLILDHIISKYPDARMTEFSKEDHAAIDELVRVKYGTWDWNFGYSPGYNFRKLIRTERSGTIEIDLDVHNGTIMLAKFFGDYFGKFDSEEIESALTGTPHKEQDILLVLEPFRIEDYFSGLTRQELISGMF